MRHAADWIMIAAAAIALAGGGFVITVAVAGCKPKAAEAQEHGHKHAEGEKTGAHGKEEKAEVHEEGEKAGVAFKAGRGLQRSAEIIKALGLSTVEAAERPLAAVVNIGAQVFATKPQVLAVANMAKEEGERLKKQRFTGAKINQIDRTATSATHLVEVVFALERTPPPEIGDFVTLTLTSEPQTALAVPRSSVLDGATGTFVYVVNGEFYLRTPVKLGTRTADHVEITDGLYSGDVVVVSPVDQLWLAELRLTKGGGHSH